MVMFTFHAQVKIVSINAKRNWVGHPKTNSLQKPAQSANFQADKSRYKSIVCTHYPRVAYLVQ